MNIRTLVDLKHLSVSFDESEKNILQDVSFLVKEEEIVGLVGESGSGKSTLAYVLCGLKKPNQGEVKFFTQEIALVMQNPQTSLDPLKSIGWTLEETLKAFLKEKKRPSLSKEERKRLLSEKLTQFDIDPKRMKDYPYQFSGGELQRICILRALLREPKLLILDEATSMLDVLVQAKIMRFLLQLQKKYGLTYLLISHDRELVQLVCDRVYCIQNKNLIEHRLKGANIL